MQQIILNITLRMDLSDATPLSTWGLERQYVFGAVNKSLTRLDKMSK